MKLAIVNGSPRGEKSNSKRMGTWIASKQEDYPDLVVETHYLFKINRHDDYIETLEGADVLLFIFPLYVDSMPGIVKAFFEKMEQKKQAFQGKPVYFIIHSGFPELIQNRSLEGYLTYFTNQIMGMNHLGTIIWPGSEALQMAPDNFFKKRVEAFKNLLPTLLEKRALPVDISEQLGGKEVMSQFQIVTYSLNPFKDFYWKMQLKKNNAKHQLKDQPYA